MQKVFQLGPLEQEVMEIIWSRPTVTVREVFEVVKKKREIAYTTIMTIMNRLVTKGYLNQIRSGKTYSYTPKKNQEQTLRSLVKQTLNTFINQFGEEAVAAFLDEADARQQKSPKKS